MAMPCSVCVHQKLREITADLMKRVPYRTIETRYSLSRSAIERHVSNHVSKALRQLAAGMSMSDAAAIAEPVLVEMRKLNQRTLRILDNAEIEDDHAIALGAIREVRRNLELIGKLTGELDPRTAGESGSSPLTVTIQYVDKQLVTNAQPQIASGDPE